VFGAWREMSRELQVRTLPWGIPAFALFATIWVAGLLAGRTDLGADAAFVLSGLGVCTLLTYYGLFADPIRVVAVGRLVADARRGAWRRVLEEMPFWPTTLALDALFALATAFVGGGQDEQLDKLLPFAPFALVLLAARDAGILVFFSLSVRPRRVEATAMVYMILLSSILPGFLGAVGAKRAALLLLPVHVLDGPRAPVVMALQAAVVWTLVLLRWKRLRRP
jgi:hypothetical protein